MMVSCRLIIIDIIIVGRPTILWFSAGWFLWSRNASWLGIVKHSFIVIGIVVKDININKPRLQKLKRYWFHTWSRFLRGSQCSQGSSYHSWIVLYSIPQLLELNSACYSNGSIHIQSEPIIHGSSWIIIQSIKNHHRIIIPS